MSRLTRLAAATCAVACLLSLPAPAAAQEGDEPEPPMLLGRCTADDLGAEPFATWYREQRDAYEPRADILAALRAADRTGLDVTIFFGTWCGDSRREVPRLLRVLDKAGFGPEAVRLVAVDRAPEAVKRSPGGEEVGREIWRVPTAIVARDGVEVGRIVEHPVLSLERDLLAVVHGEEYRPSYRAYPLVRQWLEGGLLADPNVSPSGLAETIRPSIGGEGDLQAAASVLRSRGQVAEAVTLCRVNVDLYRESAGARAALAEALLEAGDREGARAAALRAIALTRESSDAGFLAERLTRIASP